jgi:hypothetical protein
MDNCKIIGRRYKVQPSGNGGAVITLHPDWREDNGVQIGDFVHESTAPDGVGLLISPVSKKVDVS